jgi:hypothetical protein
MFADKIKVTEENLAGNLCRLIINRILETYILRSTKQLLYILIFRLGLQWL